MASIDQHLSTELLWLLPLILGASALVDQVRPCVKRSYDAPDSIVCVCNATYCDTIAPLGELRRGQAAVYTTSKGGLRLERTDATFGVGKPADGDLLLKVDGSRTFQTVIGFGGAFTDSVGINLKRLSEATRERLIRAYYAEEGIQYSLGRVPIASCDFSTHEYSYLDRHEDFDLRTFGLAKEDLELKIPFVLSALNLTNGDLKLFASPWSAPGWMKTNGQMKGGGQLKGEINGPYYQTWAKYLVRFFEEYSKRGILYWGLTTQNEPSSGLIKSYAWQTMFWDSQMQRKFIKVLLGPMLKNNTVTARVKVMVNDDNRYMLPSYVNEILEDPEAAKYVHGTGVHWYADFLFDSSRLTETHDLHPDKFILATEACNGYMPFFHGPMLGSWFRGEAYGQSIIEDMQHWVAGWTDWNLCLDEQGGPNFASNYVDSPIIVNSTSDEFYKQPTFYYMGHFSKFIRPGSKRVSVNAQSGTSSVKNLQYIAFTTPENKRVIVLHYRDWANRLSVRIQDAMSNLTLKLELEPRSINTVVWNKP